MGEIRARLTFGQTIAQSGLTRVRLSQVCGASERTLAALARPESYHRGSTPKVRMATAAKIAQGYASATGVSKEEAFAMLFEDEHVADPRQAAQQALMLLETLLDTGYAPGKAVHAAMTELHEYVNG
jgi:hypothetical protein